MSLSLMRYIPWWRLWTYWPPCRPWPHSSGKSCGQWKRHSGSRAAGTLLAWVWLGPLEEVWPGQAPLGPPYLALTVSKATWPSSSFDVKETCYFFTSTLALAGKTIVDHDSALSILKIFVKLSLHVEILKNEQFFKYCFQIRIVICKNRRDELKEIIRKCIIVKCL